MTLSVPPDLQYGLLEFIAHMNAEDYDALPEDFVKIGMLQIYSPSIFSVVCIVLAQRSHMP